MVSIKVEYLSILLYVNKEVIAHQNNMKVDSYQKWKSPWSSVSFLSTQTEINPFNLKKNLTTNLVFIMGTTVIYYAISSYFQNPIIVVIVE